MSNNPYETSFTNVSNQNDLPTSVDLDVDVKQALASLARWQTFFAVLGAIFCGLLFLLMFAQIASGMLYARGTSVRANALGASAFALVGMGIFYILPTIKLFQATSAIRKYGYDGSSLRNVIEAQRSFWRTIGVLAIIAIGLYFSFFVLMILWSGLARF